MSYIQPTARVWIVARTLNNSERLARTMVDRAFGIEIDKYDEGGNDPRSRVYFPVETFRTKVRSATSRKPSAPLATD